jgi:ArsR family transcriptional regulator
MTKDLPLLLELNPDEIRLAAMLKALGNPVRFRIMQYLAERQMCITGEIVEFTTLAQSTVSQHLNVLREAGLICYCISISGIRFLKAQVEKWLPDCCKAAEPVPAQSNCC